MVITREVRYKYKVVFIHLNKNINYGNRKMHNA